jgi:lysophospholipase L1-like esterase
MIHTNNGLSSKGAFCLMIGMVLFGGCGTGRPADDPNILKGLVLNYFDGVRDKSLRQLQTVSTDDFVIWEFGKIWNNDSVFKNIRYHTPFSVRFELTDFKPFMDATSAEASYTSHAHFVFNDTIKVDLEFIESATFRKTPSGWKINFIHVSAKDSPFVNIRGYYQRYDTVRYFREHYAQRIQLFNKEPLTTGGILFLGNSITEFGDWKTLLRDSSAVNRGIAADNTFGMLDRLDDVVAHRPKKLFIEAGINDIAQQVPPAFIIGNIHSITDYVQAKSPDTKIYVFSILPTNDDVKKEYPALYGRNDIVWRVDSLITQHAATDGYTYVDLAARLRDEKGNLAAKFARPDGLHLNEAGYAECVALLQTLP